MQDSSNVNEPNNYNNSLPDNSLKAVLDGMAQEPKDTKDPQNDVWVFLSHSNEDYDKVRVVRNILEEYNFRPIMFFLRCLNDNEEVDQLIKREINCRTRFILCDSENARRSKWVQREVQYIKELKRSYFTLDLTRSKETIEQEIQTISSNATIFISCPRERWNFARELVSRLKKYDFNVFFDDFSPFRDEAFQTKINNEIGKAKAYGLFVSLVSRSTFDPSRGSNEELHMALNKGSRIVPIFMEKYLPEGYLLDKLKTMEYADLSDTQYPVEMALRHILKVTHQPGSLLTLAENFFNSSSFQKEWDEIHLCGCLVLDAANEHPEDCGLLSLKGKCYEYGFGTEVNLKKAYDCYSEAYRNGKIETAKEGMRRLESKLGIDQEQTSGNQGEKGLMSAFRRLFRGSKSK